MVREVPRAYLSTLGSYSTYLRYLQSTVDGRQGIALHHLLEATRAPGHGVPLYQSRYSALAGDYDSCDSNTLVACMLIMMPGYVHDIAGRRFF